MKYLRDLGQRIVGFVYVVWWFAWGRRRERKSTTGFDSNI